MSGFYQQLLSHIDRSVFFRAFNSDLESSNRGVCYYKTNNSLKMLLVAHAFSHTKKNILVVALDDKIAEEYVEDLDVLIGERHCAIIPDYEVLPYEQRSPHYSIRAKRVEALTRILEDEPGVFVISLRSLLRRIVPKDSFKQNLINVKQGVELNQEELIIKLVEMGYESDYQVNKLGQFAHRGGIIDIFAPGFDYPIRLDFFGDEIESIRHFDPVTQRSKGNVIKFMNIMPMREFCINDIDRDSLRWQQNESGFFYNSIENDVSILLPQTETIPDYFGDNTIFFFDEIQYLENEVQHIYEELFEYYQREVKTSTLLLPKPDEMFAGEEIFTQIKKREYYLLNANKQLFHEEIESRAVPYKPPEVMLNDLTMFEQFLDEHIDKGWSIVIQSDNKSQSKRMQEMLIRLSSKLSFTIGVLHKGFNLEDIRLSIYTDHEIFNRYKKKGRKFTRKEALVDYETLKPGDYIVHIDHGIGMFEGLELLTLDGNQIECLALRYEAGDKIYVPTHQLKLVTRFVADEGVVPKMNKIGSKRWDNTKERVKKQIEEIAEDILNLYAERKMRPGLSIERDTVWQEEMEDAFIYEDTPDQKTATAEIKSDLEAPYPMERLLCGDVGFGKTEVAIRAAFKVVMSGYQVGVLVPTTLLAEQHYNVFRERLAQYPVRIAMLSRFRTPKQIKDDLAGLATGEVDIIVGTHRLLSKDVQFKRAGLLIVDEEHRFGVRQKDKIRSFKANIDTLYMSATPIPRTLNMALSKLKEISLIQTSPKERLPVRTVVTPYNDSVVKEAIQREVDRGGQVFYVHNRVQTIDSEAEKLRKLLPNVSFAIGHGQMPERQLETLMNDFVHNKFQVLISTTIIENGIDIPNANTIIINRSDRFGLAQLYQMRGRVGRSSRRAYAYLLVPKGMTPIAMKRLEAIAEYDYLGAGFQVAMRDLEIRGAGNLLGTKQSGLINTVGINYYNRLLQQAVEHLESGNMAFEEEAVPLKKISVKQDVFFPTDYIKDDTLRIQMYKRLGDFSSSAEFDEFKVELEDRFGKLPERAEKTVDFHKLKFMATGAGLASVKVRDKALIMDFDEKTLPPQAAIGKFITQVTSNVKFDTTKGLRIIIEFDKKVASHKDSIYLSTNYLSKFKSIIDELKTKK